MPKDGSIVTKGCQKQDCRKEQSLRYCIVVDIGNTNTVIGLLYSGNLTSNWRISTSTTRTSDEYSVLFQQLFQQQSSHDIGDYNYAIVSSVVPGSTLPCVEGLTKIKSDINIDIIDSVENLGMPIDYNPPQDVGADRIINAIAAYEKFNTALVVVDFGTATTFDCISSSGTYLGGIIVPGIDISAEALYQRAAKLPRVDLKAPNQVLGKSTVESIQSGLFHGYTSLVDGIINKLRTEMSESITTIATGGLARIFTASSSQIEHYDELLTLRGLYLAASRRQPT